MRTPILLAVCFAAVARPGLCQDSDAAAPPPPHTAHARHHHHVSAGGTGEKPVDLGPNTPDANKAYQGGGVVLQGAPGAPAPTPQATPSGQTPRGAVPPQ